MDFPVWWRRSALLQKYAARRFDTGNPFYVDYALLLTFGEAAAWDKECRQAYPADMLSQQGGISAAMDELAARLDAASWVIVESYEWESGFD